MIGYALISLGILLVVGIVWATCTLVGVTISTSVSGFAQGNSSNLISDEQGLIANPTVLAAQPSVLTTRTNNTSGSLTMTNSSHGITTGQRVDLYWTGGHCYGAVVGTVAGTTVPIASVSGGDNLPIATTAISVGIPNDVAFGLTGNNLSALILNPGTAQNGYFVFNNGSSDVYAVYIPSGQISEWHTGAVGANPLSGATPTKVYCSHDNTGASVAAMIANALTH